MKNRVLIVILLFNFSFAASAQSKKASQLMKEYLDVAQWNKQGVKQVLTKWENTDTLKYYVHGKFTYIDVKSWQKFLEEISVLTGLVFVETDNKNDHQIKIYFGTSIGFARDVNDNTPGPVLEKMPYWTSKKWDAQRRLTYAAYSINPTVFCMISTCPIIKESAVLISAS